MITVKSGDIFTSRAQVLVNPVNCVGVMGAGLAKEFKNRFLKLDPLYRRGCALGEVAIGRVQFVSMSNHGPIIANFPTKMDWRVPSTLEYIERGLTSLVSQLTVGGYTSVAIPAIGCGLDGLKFEDVKSRIEFAFEKCPEIEVTIYNPQ